MSAVQLTKRDNESKELNANAEAITKQALNTDLLGLARPPTTTSQTSLKKTG